MLTNGVFFLLLFFLFFSFEYVEADASDDCTSPVFSREIDVDSNLPFDYFRESDIKDRPDLDITHVSFFSDTKTLNATIWLNEFPREKTTSWLTYGIAIDSDFNLDKGDVGADFGHYYEYIGDKSLLRDNEDPNVKPESWYLVTTEFVSINKYQETRNIMEDANFYNHTTPTISFSVHLRDIGNCPEKYRILFYATDYKEQQYEITDITRWIEIPPAKFNFSSNPNSVELEIGGQESIEILLESTSALEHKVNFSIPEQLSQKLENLEIELVDQGEQILSPNSFVTNHIIVKAPVTNTQKTTSTIGISAEIQRSDDFISQYKNDYHLPTTIFLSDEEPSLIHSTSFSVTILSFWDLVWSSFERIEVIVGVISTIIGIITAIYKLTKRRHKIMKN